VKRSFQLTVCPLVGGRWAGYLHKHLVAAHKMLRSSVRDLSVAVVDEPLMRQLHRRYLKSSSSTDVLSFELDADGHGNVLAGQIVICLPVARRSARGRGLAVGRELLLYALHGLLHLSGWDDRTEAGFQAMHAKEDEILIRLGVGRVFRPPGGRLASGVSGTSRGAR
jgi:probable rRNA maturation factor